MARGIIRLLVAQIGLFVSVEAHCSVLDVGTLDVSVAKFLASELPGSAAVPVDRRLRLAACVSPLAFDWATGGRALSVTCAGAGGWQIYVPVAASGEGRVQRQSGGLAVRVLSNLTRGSIVDANNVEVVPVEGPQSGDLLRRVEDASGQRLLRSVTAGTTLRLSMLEQTPTVRRRDRVTLVANAPGITVSADGEALEEGRPGSRVLVRNLSSGERIRGIAGVDGNILIGR